MSYLNVKKKILNVFSFAFLMMFAFAYTQALACNVSPSPSASLKGIWVDEPKPANGQPTYKFIVNYVPPKSEQITSCRWVTERAGFPSFGIVTWEECTTTQKCTAGYFEATFTLDNLTAQNSVKNVKLKGVENGTWVSFDHKRTTNNSNGSVTTTLYRYWLHPTSDRNKATFVIWTNPETAFRETWKDPLTRVRSSSPR